MHLELFDLWTTFTWH